VSERAPQLRWRFDRCGWKIDEWLFNADERRFDK
jgi:hypothetical protein